MTQEHMPRRRIRRPAAKHRRHGLGVVLQGILGVDPADVGGLYKGQEEHLHRAICVRKRHRRRGAVEGGRHINPALVHEPAAEGKALGGIVVAADEHNGSAQLGEGG